VDTAAVHVVTAYEPLVSNAQPNFLKSFCCFNKIMAIKMTKVLNCSQLDGAML
jgi:hypothetical protein